MKNSLHSSLTFIALAMLLLVLSPQQSRAQCGWVDSCVTNQDPVNMCGLGDDGSQRLLESYGAYGWCWQWNCVLGLGSIPSPPPNSGVFICISTCDTETSRCSTCSSLDSTAKYFHIRNLTGCPSTCGPYGYTPGSCGPPILGSTPGTSEIIDSVDVIGTPASLSSDGRARFKVCDPYTNFGDFQVPCWDYHHVWSVEGVQPQPLCTEILFHTTANTCDSMATYFCDSASVATKYFRVRLTFPAKPAGNVQDLGIWPLGHLTFVLRGMDEVYGIVVYYRIGVGGASIGHDRHLFTGLTIHNKRCPDGTSMHDCEDMYNSCTP